MPIHVTSEIGPLRRVLLQRPGRELEHLSPETMEQLLFDDIPFLHRAQQEHDRFAELLREATSLPVTLWDERRTTVDAHNILLSNGKRAKERKKTVDAVAASLMLEGYLTFKKRQQ